MKTLTKFIALTWALAFTAAAQNAGVYTLGGFDGGTNVIAAASTNTTAPTFAVSQYNTVGIQVTLAASTTNVTPVTLYFAKSVDSTNYETTPSLSVEVTPNGTATVTKFSSLDVTDVAVLKLSHFANSNANGYVTNVTVKYRLKSEKVTSR